VSDAAGRRRGGDLADSAIQQWNKGLTMAIAFPNRARSYDENAKRIRFLGHDGMFEIRFSLDIDVLTKGKAPGATSESGYLAAFDALRTGIIDVARRVYGSKRENSIVLKLSDFK
jgi:Protein of unknown function (DUF1488)